MPSTYITRTPTSNSASRTAITVSMWIKRSGLGALGTLFHTTTSNSGYLYMALNVDDQIDFALQNTDYTQSAPTGFKERKITNRKLRDVNGWYHIVCTVDTSLATATDRLKIYINGVQETSWSHETNNTQQNQALPSLIGSTSYPYNIGRQGNNSYFYNGSISHFHYVDGTAYGASTFGSTDSTTGEWKINVDPSVTYGTNGFFILKDGNSVTDQSGNGNNFTVGAGTLTNTEDCPDNVFCTWNRLAKGSYIDMNYGNTNVYGNTVTNNGNTWGTISFPPSGKYYWETKVISYHANASSGYPQIGIIRDNTISQGDMNGGTGGYVSSSNDCYYPAGGTTIYSKNGNVTVSATSLNDIIMCAMDSTAGNMKFWMGVNGTWFNSGDPANGTNAIWTETGDYQPVPFMSGYNGSRGDSNFGNGYFGTTAVSSAGTNASNIGIFEYDVPTGFTALSTKGLNE